MNRCPTCGRPCRHHFCNRHCASAWRRRDPLDDLDLEAEVIEARLDAQKLINQLTHGAA